MATKDITDTQVLQAYIDSASIRSKGKPIAWPEDLLMTRTGEAMKVCTRAMERAHRRGLVDYGVSLRSGWLTEAGHTHMRGCHLTAA